LYITCFRRTKQCYIVYVCYIIVFMSDCRKFIRGGIIKSNTKKYIIKNVFLANNKICQNCTRFSRYQIKTEVFAVVRLQTLLFSVRLIVFRGANAPYFPPPPSGHPWSYYTSHNFSIHQTVFGSIIFLVINPT
jgi:hypothetical protein